MVHATRTTTNSPMSLVFHVSMPESLDCGKHTLKGDGIGASDVAALDCFSNENSTRSCARFQPRARTGAANQAEVDDSRQEAGDSGELRAMVVVRISVSLGQRGMKKTMNRIVFVTFVFISCSLGGIILKK